MFALCGSVQGDELFKVGESSGLIQESDDDNGSVEVVTLVGSDGFSVVFQLDKLWKTPPTTAPGIDSLFTTLTTTPIGEVAAPPRTTIVFMPSAAQANIPGDEFVIIIKDEKLKNQTSVVWQDFHITVEPLVGDATVTLSGSPDVGPAPRLPLWQLTSNGTGQLDFYGGQWDNDGVFFSLFDNAFGSDMVKITVKLGTTPSQFIIKEWPTVPEPATMALLGLGALPLLRRRKRR